jgi:hypothetical protein
MTREAAIDSQAIARHFLNETTVSSPRLAEEALTARHDSGNDDFLSDPFLISCDNGPGDFVPQRQGWFLYGGNTIIEITKVSVAHPASSHFH